MTDELKLPPTPSEGVTPELKPCPFCGRVPALMNDLALVQCTTDGCVVRGMFIKAESWNARRTPSSAPPTQEPVAGKAWSIIRKAIDASSAIHHEYGAGYTGFEERSAKIDALASAVVDELSPLYLAAPPAPPSAELLPVVTRSLSAKLFGVMHIAHRGHWHIVDPNGVDLSDIEPCFKTIGEALDRADELNAASLPSSPTAPPDVREAVREALTKLLAKLHSKRDWFLHATDLEKWIESEYPSLPASAEQPK